MVLVSRALLAWPKLILGDEMPKVALGHVVAHAVFARPACAPELQVTFPKHQLAKLAAVHIFLPTFGLWWCELLPDVTNLLEFDAMIEVKMCEGFTSCF